MNSIVICSKKNKRETYGLIELTMLEDNWDNEIFPQNSIFKISNRMISTDLITVMDDEFDCSIMKNNLNVLPSDYSGLYYFKTVDGYDNHISLLKISDDTSELISNMDSNDNFIKFKNHIYYHCGSIKSDRDNKFSYEFYYDVDNKDIYYHNVIE